MDLFSSNRHRDDSSLSSGASTRPMLQPSPWDNQYPVGDLFGGATGMQPEMTQFGAHQAYGQPGQPFVQSGQPIAYGTPGSVQGQQQPNLYPTSMASQDYQQQEGWIQDQAFLPHETIGHEEPPSPTRTKWLGSAAVCCRFSDPKHDYSSLYCRVLRFLAT